MTKLMQALISEADEMGKLNESGSGTSVIETSTGSVRVYRERNVRCMNMKRFGLKTSWKLNGKVISEEKLIAALK